MEYAPYALAEQEQEIGLRYVPGAKDERRKRMTENLQKLGDHMGFDPQPPVVPPKGFLERELTEEQRRTLDCLLSRTYAERNAMQQRELLSVAVEESREPMVSLPDVLRQEGLTAVTYSSLPFHDACGSWSAKARVYAVRHGVAQRFVTALRALGVLDLTAHIEDCWRPWQVQRGLFVRRLVDLARQFPEWDRETVRLVTGSLTAPMPGLAGHQAGAAIDSRLRSLRPGNALMELGNDYAQGGVCTSIDSPHITERQWETRTYFAEVMRMAGFKLLRTENWHASHGDRGMGHDGAVRMKTAHYGPLLDFQRKAGVEPYPNGTFDIPFFTDSQCDEIVSASRKRLSSGQFLFLSSELFSRYGNASID